MLIFAVFMWEGKKKLGEEKKKKKKDSVIAMHLPGFACVSCTVIESFVNFFFFFFFFLHIFLKKLIMCSNCRNTEFLKR